MKIESIVNIIWHKTFRPQSLYHIIADILIMYHTNNTLISALILIEFWEFDKRFWDINSDFGVFLESVFELPVSPVRQVSNTLKHGGQIQAAT